MGYYDVKGMSFAASEQLIKDLASRTPPENLSVATDWREEADKHLREAEACELYHAKEKHPGFASAHEVWAVLMEEYEELMTDINQLEADMAELWDAAKRHDHEAEIKALKLMAFTVRDAISVVLQICAVAQKAIDGITERQVIDDTGNVGDVDINPNVEPNIKPNVKPEIKLEKLTWRDPAR
jgi:hypothetical protein